MACKSMRAEKLELASFTWSLSRRATLVWFATREQEGGFGVSGHGLLAGSHSGLEDGRPWEMHGHVGAVAGT